MTYMYPRSLLVPPTHHAWLEFIEASRSPLGAQPYQVPDRRSKLALLPDLCFNCALAELIAWLMYTSKFQAAHVETLARSGLCSLYAAIDAHNIETLSDVRNHQVTSEG